MNTETKFSVPDISCGGCANGIKNALGKVAGINQVEVDIQAKTVDIKYDANTVRESQIIDVLDDAGYPVEQN